jgi:catechol 2,3-dioxygenase-like lactoylglutathione lyase family enzyme
MPTLVDGELVAFLYVADRSRALDFYCDTLGLSVRSSDPFGDFLAGAGSLIRMTVMPDHRPGPHPVLGWNVADVRATAARLRAAGVELLIYEGFDQDDLGVWAAPDGATKVAWLADPDGNVLSLAQAVLPPLRGKEDPARRSAAEARAGG